MNETWTSTVEPAFNAANLDGARRDVARLFASAGMDSPEFDARLLLEAATGLSRENIVLAPSRTLTTGEVARLREYVARRLDHEPVSRILGHKQFHGREFEVTPDTLDPRPETETLVDLVLQIVREQGSHDRPLRILDACTGTGCILLALLSELPNASGVGTDISPAALAVARRNAQRQGLDTRTQWLPGDVLGGVTGPFDLVVANPPYIPSRDIALLAPEVRRFDPHLALDGGDDGLAVYRRLVLEAGGVAPSGWCAVEVGSGQAPDVIALIESLSSPPAMTTIRTAKDFGGHTRCVAWKPHSEIPQK